MDLEPLVTHLEPQFGNIYDYTSWTDELKAAVRHYLIEVAPEELYAKFLDHVGYEVPSGTRGEQADFILDKHSPWQVGSGFHDAAVVTAPSLDQLIDQIEAVPPTGDQEDAALWLKKHATEEQIIRMAQYSGQTELRRIKDGSGHRNPDAYDLAEVVTLPQLRVLWFHVTFEVYNPTAGSRKRQTAKPTHGTVSPPEPSQVRQWARARGYNIADRGRIPASVMEAFESRIQFPTYITDV